MELNEYQKQARVTRLPLADSVYCLYNLSAEVGELLGVIAKARRKGTKPETEAVLKECGDILWQLAAVADDFGLSLQLVASTNLDKLADRSVRGVLDGVGDNR